MVLAETVSRPKFDSVAHGSVARSSEARTVGPFTPAAMSARVLSAVVLVCGFAAHGNPHAGNEDLRPHIGDAEFGWNLSALSWDLQFRAYTLNSARASLDATLSALAAAEAEFNEATALFAEVEKNPAGSGAPSSAASSADSAERLDDAWRTVASAWAQLQTLTATRDRKQTELRQAEQRWEQGRVFLDKYKNDYEAQSDPFAVRDSIARCVVESCSPSDFLADERVAVFQPRTLEMIGAHHAYARGLTGKGVRIGIEDDIVSYRLPEFEGRISFEGANLLYPLYEGDDRLEAARRCDQAAPGEAGELNCRIISYSSADDGNLFDNLVMRWTIARYGWPDDETQWWGEQFRKILPQTWRTFMQTGVSPGDRTLVVYAAAALVMEHFRGQLGNVEVASDAGGN